MDQRSSDVDGVPGLLSTASFRLAAYAVCIEGGRLLLVRCVSPEGASTWSLPGGRVEQGEDPFDAQHGCGAQRRLNHRPGAGGRE